MARIMPLPGDRRGQDPDTALGPEWVHIALAPHAIAVGCAERRRTRCGRTAGRLGCGQLTGLRPRIADAM